MGRLVTCHDRRAIRVCAKSPVRSAFRPRAPDLPARPVTGEIWGKPWPERLEATGPNRTVRA